MSRPYDVGDRPRWKFVFRDYDGALADPVLVRVVVKPPTGAERVYVYGTDAEIERVSIGLYRFALPLTAPKDWGVRFQGMHGPSTADAIVATDLKFTVRTSPVVGVFP